jgi:transposase
MRYELTDFEWTAIKIMLPNKPRGVPRVDDRRVLSAIFWVLRSGAPWRDLPDSFGPYTTCYNRFIPLATTASVAGDGPVSGVGSWTPWPRPMMGPCR